MQELSILRVNEGEAAYAVDCRGVGASRAGPPDAKPTGYGADYQLHAHRLMLGESSLGRRVYDLRRVIQLLRGVWTQSNAESPPLRLVGNGQGALVATFAALLDDHDVTIDIVHAPLACAAWAETPLCTWPVSSVLRGMLKHFDMPDVYNALGKTKARRTALATARVYLWAQRRKWNLRILWLLQSMHRV